MTETTVGADLLEALEIVTELGVDVVGENLGVLAVDDVALSVEEPGRDLVLGGVLHDGDDALEFFGGDFTGTNIRCQPIARSRSFGWWLKICRRSVCLMRGLCETNRLFKSTSAFLQTKLE